MAFEDYGGTTTKQTEKKQKSSFENYGGVTSKSSKSSFEDYGGTTVSSEPGRIFKQPTAPTSSAPAPAPKPPASYLSPLGQTRTLIDLPSGGVAQEPPRETRLVRPNLDRPVYAPQDEGQLVRLLAGQVTPEERVAFGGPERIGREQFDIFKGGLQKTLSKSGAPLLGSLAEYTLNPFTIAEAALAETGLKTAGRGLKIGANKLLGEEAFRVPSANPVALSRARNIAEISKRKSLGEVYPTYPGTENVPAISPEHKAKVFQALENHPDVSNVTPNDPLGTIPKRLALPGEPGGEIIQMPRTTASDPMGVLQPRKIRLVPRSQPIPDNLIAEVNPENIPKIISNVDNIVAKNVPTGISPATKGVISKGATQAEKRVIDNVNSNVITEGEDLALHANTRQAIQVETEMLRNPEAVIEQTKSIPVTTKNAFFRFIDAWVDPSKDAIARVHPLGKIVSKLYDEGVTVADVREGRAMHLINESMKGISGTPLESNLVDVLQGEASPATPAVKKAAIVVRGILDQIADESGRLGLKITRTKEGIVTDWVPRKNYFPRFYNLDKLTKDISTRERAIQSFMQNKKLTRQQATNLLDRFIKDRANHFGPLEVGRVTDLPGYSRNVLDVMSNYLSGSFRRLELARQLGANNEVAGRLISQIPDEGARTLADAALQVMTGKTSRGAISEWAKSITSPLLNDVTRRLMALSTISNIDQGVYGSVIRMNLNSVRKGLRDSFKGMSRQDAKESGVILRKFVDLFDDNINDLTNFFNKNQFAASEEKNRIITKLSSDHYTKKILEPLIKKDPQNPYLIRELKNLGMDPEKIIKQGNLTRDQIDKIGVRITALTQGRFEPASMPILASTPLGKILFQLKSFDILWTRMIRDYVIPEARAGNYRPMLKLFLSGQISGEIKADIWATISGRDRPEVISRNGINFNNLLNRMAENFAFSSTLGVFSDLAVALTLGDSRPIERGSGAPLLSVGQEATKAGIGLAHGEFKPAAKFAARRIVTPAVAGRYGLTAGIITRTFLDRLLKGE